VKPYFCGQFQLLFCLLLQAESGRKVHEMCLLNVYDVKVLKSVLSFKEYYVTNVTSYNCNLVTFWKSNPSCKLLVTNKVL